VKDSELGENVCESCGLVIDKLNLVNQRPHEGTPSFNFMYDKALPTVFDARDAKVEQVDEFRRLASLDRSIRGVRRGEATVLNAQRKILPMAERLCAGKPELLKNVKARIAELALEGLPRIAGVYPAAVCQALLECGVRQEKKKLLTQLTVSSRAHLGKVRLKYDAGAAAWVGTFELKPYMPSDGYFVKVSATAPSGGKVMRGIATHEFKVVLEKCEDENGGDPASRSRRVDDRLTVSVSTERKAYRIGESICVSAQVRFPDGTILDDKAKDAKVEAAFSSGGRLRAAEKALWILRKRRSLGDEL